MFFRSAHSGSGAQGGFYYGNWRSVSPHHCSNDMSLDLSRPSLTMALYLSTDIPQADKPMRAKGQEILLALQIQTIFILFCFHISTFHNLTEHYQKVARLSLHVQNSRKNWISPPADCILEA